jgi:hypothetical protein
MFDDLPRMAGLVSKLLSLDELFKGRHFDAEIIVLCVRWDLQYKLSYRDLAGTMAERGISVAHERRWIAMAFLRCGASATLYP